MTRTCFILTVLSIAMCLGTLEAIAQTSWKGVTSTTWNDATNWTNGVPTSTVDAIIGDASFTGSFQPAITTSSACKSLTIGTGAVASTLTFSRQNRNLTVSGNVTIGAVGTITQGVKSNLALSGDWQNAGTYSATNNNAVVIFNGSVQTLSGATTFRKLTINAGSTLTLNANITTTRPLTVNGTLNPNGSPTYTIGGTGTMSVNAGGRIMVQASTFGGNYTKTGAITLAAGSIVEYASATINQTVSNALTYSTLRISGGTTKTLAGNLPALNSSSAATGVLDVIAGTLDLSSFAGNRGTVTAGGSVNVANGATLRIGGTNTFPANYVSHVLGSTSTIEYSGTNQTISAEAYGHLTLSSSGGSITKTMPGVPLSVAGNLTSSVGAGTGVVFTAAAPITVAGNLTIGSSTTFNGGATSHTVSGNWVTDGTFNGGTSTVTLDGLGAVLSGGGAASFFNLTFAGPGITAAAAASFTVAGDLATSGAGTFTHAAGSSGTVTMSGTGKTISGAAITFNNLSVSGAITTASSFTAAGNLSVAGSLSATAGVLTMSGASKTISTIGPLGLYGLNVTGSISTASSFTMSSNLSVPGSLSATAGTVTFVGTSVLSGTAHLFHVTLSGTSLQLGAGSVLGIAGALALSAGTFDVSSTTPNTTTYNGTGAQSVTAATYDHLTFGGTGTKSAAGALTVNRDLTISAGSAFSSGVYAHSVYRNWNNGGTFTAGSGTVQLLGSLTAAMTGTTTFNVLIINKSLASTAVNLNATMTAATVNVVSGTVYTGSNAVVITSSRTGNGIILGTITRTHAFTNGTPYAFEGPFNTYTFSSGASAVTSITTTVTTAPVTDFPFGASMNREYAVALSASGAYSATVRLHYDESEINGNVESTVKLWRNSGSWTNVGKSGNNSTDNWVELSGVSALAGRWTISDDVNAVEWNGSVSTAWENGSNWTVVEGAPSVPPSAGEIVELGTAAFVNQPLLSTPATVKNILFGSAQAVSLTVGAGGSLTTSGNIAGFWSGASSHTINIGSQSLTVGGGLLLSDGASGHDISLSMSGGQAAISGSLTQAGGAAINAFGDLVIGGDFVHTSGTFTAGSGTVTYNGAASQAVAGGITYNNITINKPSGTATLSSSASATGNLTLAGGGTFDLGSSPLDVSGAVSIGAGTILNGGSATLSVQGDWTRNGSFVPSSGTVSFTGSASEAIGGTTFNNLTIAKGAGSATLAGNLLVNGNLSMSGGTFDLGSFTADRSSSGGLLSMSAGTTLKVGGSFPANFAATNFATTSTVDFTGLIAQSVPGLSYGNLTCSGTSGAKTLAAPASVAGDLTIGPGSTFGGSSFALTLQGNWTNNGSFNAGTGSVTLGGTSRTLSGATSFQHLIVSGSYTGTGDIAVNGNTTVSGSYQAGVTQTTFAGNFANSGTFSSAGAVIFPGATAQSIGLNAGFTSTGSVDFNGTVAPSFSGSTTPTIGDVTINNTGGVTPGVGWLVNGTFTVAPTSSFSGASLTHTFFGSFSNNGTVTSAGGLAFTPTGSVSVMLRGISFSSSGTVVFGGSGPIATSGNTPVFSDVLVTNTNSTGITAGTDWTVNGNLTIAGGGTLNGGSGTVLTVGGNFTNNGTFDGSSSTVAMTNPTAAEIGGSGASTFHNLTISGVITATADIGLSGDFTNNGTFDGSGVTLTFSGSTPSLISGTTTPTPIDDIVVAKASGASTTLGVNISTVTALAVTSGTIDNAAMTITQDATLGGVLTLAAGGTMRIGGSNALPTFDTYSLSPTSTVEYYGGIQTVANSTPYGHLVLSTGGTKTAAGALTINGDFTLSSATFTGGSFVHSLRGNWTMSSGAFTNSGTTIKFDGTVPQNISSTGAFQNVTLQKATGGLTAATDVVINGVLALSGGNLVTGANKVSIGSGGSVSRTSGHVVGNLEKYVATGATARTFEIGDASSYTPVGVTFASVTTPGTLNARTTPGDHPAISTSGLDSLKSVNRFWSLTSAGTAFTSYNAVFNFVPGDVDPGTSTGAVVVKKHDGASWSAPTVGTRTSTSTQITGSTSFSDFQIGEADANNPVPVTTGITPSSRCSGSAAFTLTVNGSSFVSGAVVRWGGSDRATTFVSPTQLTASILASDVSSPGPFSVTAFNPSPGGGVSNAQTFTVTSAPALSTTSVNVACNGGSTGSIDLTVTGGTAPYSYSWGDGPTSQDRTGLAAGSYSVTVTDSNGCTASTGVTITQPAALSLAETHVNVACNGNATGSIDLTVTGGTAPYSYSWGDGPTSQDRTGLAAGSYTVTVTDSNGCTASTGVTITQPAALSLSETHVHVTCNGGTNGSIDLTVTGGTAPYNYSWNDGPTSQDRTGLAAGSYTVTVTDSNGCTSSTSVTITQPAAVSLAETHVNVACNGNSTGSIDLTVSGGTAPYNYSWNDGPTIQDRAGLAAGSYTVTVTDNNGCSASTSITITQPAALSLSETHVNVACNGGTNGSIDLTVSGGTAPYTYSWSDGPTSQDRTGLSAGAYTVTVTDNNGCTASTSVSITQSGTMSLSETHVNVNCNGGANGSIDLTVTGGTAPFAYSWNDGPISEDRSGLAAGLYTVTVTDMNGCTALTSVTITQPAALSLSETHVNVACNGGTTGSIDLTVSGGTAPYTYSWTDGPTSQDRNALSAGSYTVTVTDNNGCTASTGVTITQPAAITLSETHVNETCNGGTTGSIDLTVTGGTAPYTYSWTDGPTSQDRNTLSAGSYTVTVTDNNGCTASTGVTITQPAAISLSETHVNVACNGGTNGSIDLTVSGGTAPYTYSWGDGPTSQDRTGLSAGTYTVTVTDNNGCTASTSVSITQSGTMTLSETHVNVGCNGGTNGSIDLTVTGGTAPFTYSWSDGPTSQDRTGLSAGTYNVTVTDINGCTALTSIIITQPAALLLSETHVNVACNGGTNGSIDLTVSGGTAPYTYSWGDGPTGQDRTGLAAGSYTVTVTDSNGCTASTSVAIAQPAAISLSETHANVACNGNSTGSINLTVSGGTAPYTYSWNDGPTTEDRTGLAAAIYTVTVTDINGCTASTSVTITQSATLSLSETHVNVACNGGTNGSINLTVSGGTAPYTYSWSDGPTSEDRTGLSAGTYTVTVTDNNGCTASTSVTITQSGTIVLSETHVNVACNGGANGSIDLSVSGGTAPYTYSWNDGPTTEDRSGLSAGTYTVTLTDNTGCTASTSVTLTQPAALALSETHVNVGCNGGSTGTIDLTVTGGTSPYTYSWDDGPTTQDRTGLASGTYTVEVSDSHGCSMSLSVTISQPALIALSETHTSVFCNGAATGIINLTVSGGASPYSYSWNDGPTTEDRTGLPAGSYTVTVSDNNGCSAAKSITITQPAALALSEVHVNVACNGGSTGAIDLAVTGGSGPFVYTWSDGPATQDRSGLSAGSYGVTVVDSNGCAASKTVSITEPAPIGISPSTILGATIGEPYSQTLSATGGTGAHRFAALGALPAGISLASGGLLSGTPTVTGLYTFTAIDSDAQNCTGSRVYALSVSKHPTSSSLGQSTGLSTAGDSVIFTDTVRGSVPDGGSVQFRDGLTTLGAPVAIDGNGVAFIAVADLAPGAHAISAFYGGTAFFDTSTSNVVHHIVATNDTNWYRTATYLQWALAADARGKLKPVKRSPVGVDFVVTIVAPDSASGFILSLNMPATAIVLRAGTDTLSPVSPWQNSTTAQFTDAVRRQESFTVSGRGFKGKTAKLKVKWLTAPRATVRSYSPLSFQLNRPGLPLPNLHNVGEELLPNATGLRSVVYPQGLMVGVASETFGPKLVKHARYRDVQASLAKKSTAALLLHTGDPRCLDNFNDSKPIARIQRGLPPSKQSNKLFAELLTLKLNVGASAAHRFPNGFGELTYYDALTPGDPFNGLLVRDILVMGDSVVACGILAGPASSITPSAMYDVVHRINGSFASAVLDTISFASQTWLKGAWSIGVVPYLHKTSEVVPLSISTNDFVEAEPLGFTLEQNYPNPFNPVTTIGFDLAQSAIVTLKVYNVIGQEVAVLLDGEAYEPGSQEVAFDASGFPSGVYFYRLEFQPIDDAEDNPASGTASAVTKKMLLLR